MLTQYSVSEIEAKAWKLLVNTWGPLIPIPVDVGYLIESNELVIDFDLIKGFEVEHGIVGVVYRLKKNKFAVFVDQDIADRSASFYRFTLAEELSHLVLHKNLINEVDSIKKAKNLLSNPDYKLMDRNAKRFAAALLMPYKIVIHDTEQLYHDIAVKSSGLGTNKYLAKIIDVLRKKYDVSRITMVHRFKEWPLNLIERIEFSHSQASDELLIV